MAFWTRGRTVTVLLAAGVLAGCSQRPAVVLIEPSYSYLRDEPVLSRIETAPTAEVPIDRQEGPPLRAERF
jgi:hypothetical protein